MAYIVWVAFLLLLAYLVVTPISAHLFAPLNAALGG
jgi:hypothetical protein